MISDVGVPVFELVEVMVVDIVDVGETEDDEEIEAVSVIGRIVADADGEGEFVSL